MKDWLNRTATITGILVALITVVSVPVGATLWINNSINGVEQRLDDRMDGLEIRMAILENRMTTIENQLAILIQGLNITVEPVTGDS